MNDHARNPPHLDGPAIPGPASPNGASPVAPTAPGFPIDTVSTGTTAHSPETAPSGRPQVSEVDGINGIDGIDGIDESVSVPAQGTRQSEVASRLQPASPAHVARGFQPRAAAGAAPHVPPTPAGTAPRVPTPAAPSATSGQFGRRPAPIVAQNGAARTGPEAGGANGAAGDSPPTAHVNAAHEALITGWTPLRSWLDTNRTALGFRQELGDAAAEWAESGGAESTLTLTDAQLANADALVRSRVLDLNRRETDYLAACIALRERAAAAAAAKDARRRRTKRRLQWGLVALLVLSMLSSVFAGMLVYAQQRQVRVSLAQALAAQAGLERERGADEAAALLARQAYLYDEDQDYPDQIGTALQMAAGGPYVSSFAGGQGSWVSGLAFSPDGRRLAAASADRSVGLLDLVPPETGQTGQTGQPIQTLLQGHDSWASSVTFHPEPRRDLLASGSGDGTVRLWKPSLGRPADPPGLLGPGGGVDAVAFDGGGLLAAGTCTTASGAPPSTRGRADPCAPGGGIVRTWALDRLDLDPVDRAVDADRVCAVAFSPDGRWLAAGGCYGGVDGPAGCAPDSGPLVIWDMTLSPGAAPRCLDGHAGDIWALAFSPDGTTLASGGEDATIRLWDVASAVPGPPAILRGHDEPVRSLAFSGDGDLLASGGHDGAVGLWTPTPTAADPVLTVLGTTTEWVRAIAFGGPSGRVLAAANAGGQIRLWDLAMSGIAPTILQGHDSYVRALAYAPAPVPSADPADPATDPAAPPLLASGAEDGTARVWRLGEASATATVLDLDTSPYDGAAPPKVSSVSFSRDGALLALGSDNGLVHVWNPARGPVPLQVGDHRSGSLVVAFSPVEDRLVAGGASGTLQFWDPAGGGPVGPPLPAGVGPAGPQLPGTGSAIVAIAFRGDGRVLAAAGRGGTIRLWDLPADGAAPVPRDALFVPGGATSLAFEREGDRLAIGGVDGATRIVEVRDGEVAHTLTGHTGEVRSVAFSPDGETLATGSIDQSVLIFATDRYDDPPGRILGLSEWVRAVAFSPDGETLAAAATEGTVRLLIPETETLADLACARVRRNLTQAEWDRFVSDKPLRVAWAFWNDAGDYQQTCPRYGGPPDNPPERGEADAAAWAAPGRRVGRGKARGHRG